MRIKRSRRVSVSCLSVSGGCCFSSSPQGGTKWRLPHSVCGCSFRCSHTCLLAEAGGHVGQRDVTHPFGHPSLSPSPESARAGGRVLGLSAAAHPACRLVGCLPLGGACGATWMCAGSPRAPQSSPSSAGDAAPSATSGSWTGTFSSCQSADGLNF